MTNERKQTEAQETDALASPNERVVLRHYTQGVMEDGAAILCDGNMMTIDMIIARLNSLDKTNIYLTRRLIETVEKPILYNADDLKDIARDAVSTEPAE